MRSVAALDLYRTSGEGRSHSMGLTLCSAEAEAGGEPMGDVAGGNGSSSRTPRTACDLRLDTRAGLGRRMGAVGRLGAGVGQNSSRNAGGPLHSSDVVGGILEPWRFSVTAQRPLQLTRSVLSALQW